MRATLPECETMWTIAMWNNNPPGMLREGPRLLILRQQPFRNARLKKLFLVYCVHKGWLPRAKLRPLVKIRLARPIGGQHFRSSFFLFGPVWFTAMNYAFMALKWWLLLSIQFMNNTWTLLYVHFHWKKTECFRVAKTQNEWSFKAKNVTVGAEEQ